MRCALNLYFKIPRQRHARVLGTYVNIRLFFEHITTEDDY